MRFAKSAVAVALLCMISAADAEDAVQISLPASDLVSRVHPYVLTVGLDGSVDVENLKISVTLRRNEEGLTAPPVVSSLEARIPASALVALPAAKTSSAKGDRSPKGVTITRKFEIVIDSTELAAGEYAGEVHLELGAQSRKQAIEFFRMPHEKPPEFPFGVYAVDFPKTSEQQEALLAEIRSTGLNLLCLNHFHRIGGLGPIFDRAARMGIWFMPSVKNPGQGGEPCRLSDGQKGGVCVNNPLVRESASQGMKALVRHFQTHPAFSSKVYFGDDFTLSMAYGNGRTDLACYCDYCREEFKALTGSEPPIEPTSLAPVVPADDLWLRWMRYRCGNIFGGFLEALEVAKNEVNPDIQMGPIHGWSEQPFTRVDAGLYPPLSQTMTAISSYSYPNLRMQRKDLISHFELAKMGNRGKDVWMLGLLAMARTVASPLQVRQNYWNQIAGGYKFISFFSWYDLVCAGASGEKERTKAAVEELARCGRHKGWILPTIPYWRDPEARSAVLYSFSTESLDVRRQSAGIDHLRKIMAFLRESFDQHVPMKVLSEEEILEGGALKNLSSLSLCDLRALDAKVLAAIEEYAAGGGRVYLDMNARVPVKGAVVTSVETMVALAGDNAPNRTQVSSPLVTLREFPAGVARYHVFVNNASDRYWGLPFNYRDPQVNYQQDALVRDDPVEATVRFSGDERWLFDLSSGEPLGSTKAPLALKLEPSWGLVACALPVRSAQIRVTAPAEAKLGETARIKLEMVDEKDRIIDAAFVAKIDVACPSGRLSRYSRYLGFCGSGEFALPTGINDESGKWTVQIQGGYPRKMKAVELNVTAVGREPGNLLSIRVPKQEGEGGGEEKGRDAPAHERPYFMPKQERERIRALIATQAWAKADYELIQAQARKGGGYQAAFLYALDGDPAYAQTAQKWLLGAFNPRSYMVGKASAALADPKYFRGGPPHLGQVFYDTDFQPYVGFDWAYEGLEPKVRQEIQEGILTSMRYKMRCMDRWVQTPNLVFKPTSIVAMAGMATQDRNALAWGFRRNPSSRIGGYFSTLNNLLKDGGAWHESPMYPIQHRVLYCASVLSRYGSLYDGKNWWTEKVPNGGSPKGLMDYYVDTAFPIERTGHGQGQIRVVTYGDGATNAKGDLFLTNPAGPGIDMTQALITAYDTSGDPRLAPFVAMIPDYKPNLLEFRPLPEKTEFPAAPSKIWPNYGLAILRAEESSAYWTSSAPVVFQLMTQSYGHEHNDKFGIIFHGAGRLLYPDYNAIQYENLDIGWSRNTIAHNTLMVDEGETDHVTPSAIRHAFTPEVKYLATSASDAFEGVDQTRALLLTREYLLDVFQADSPTPHTYDYLLHSFGAPQPLHPEGFKPSNALGCRFGLVSDRQALSTDQTWALDFVLKEEPGSREGKFGPEWYDHKAAVRVTMAAETDTLVTHGISGVELGKAVKGSFDKLGMLIVRRKGARGTVFVATHEPYAGATLPGITAVTTLARTPGAVLVRVEAKDYTDYAAVSFGPQSGEPEHVLTGAGEPGIRVAFKDYGYLRVKPDGTMIARGGWTGLRLPAARGVFTLNGEEVKGPLQDGGLAYGVIHDAPEAPMAFVECPLSVQIEPSVGCLAPGSRRALTFSVKNTLDSKVSGTFAFDLPDGITIEPAQPVFPVLEPGNAASVTITFIAAAEINRGPVTVPYRVVYRTGDGKAPAVRTAALPVTLAIGPVMRYLYRHPESNVFQMDAPSYIIQHDMLNGLCRYLADGEGHVRLDGTPLFTLGSADKDLLVPGARNAFTWLVRRPPALEAHAQDLCRFHIKYLDDRITLYMDSGWNQIDPTWVSVPGTWLSPGGAPVWKRVVAVDADGREVEAEPGTELKVVAAELAFSGLQHSAAEGHMAFSFDPPQPVTFKGAGIRFPIGSYSGDTWSVGFCRPGGLNAWRAKAVRGVGQK